MANCRILATDEVRKQTHLKQETMQITTSLATEEAGMQANKKIST